MNNTENTERGGRIDFYTYKGWMIRQYSARGTATGYDATWESTFNPDGTLTVSPVLANIGDIERWIDCHRYVYFARQAQRTPENKWVVWNTRHDCAEEWYTQWDDAARGADKCNRRNRY